MDHEITVKLLFEEDGAREAAREGMVAIIVDALRASSTTVTALAVGADAVLPVGSVDEAAAYVGRPGYRVAGERNGIKCDGFDFGNSPTLLLESRERIAGQTLVLSTSNGTRIVRVAQQGASAVLMGAALNAEAVAAAALRLARASERDIALVMAGEYGNYAEEDACAARAIARHLKTLGAHCPELSLPDEDVFACFDGTPSADELRDLGYEPDIAFCARQDHFAVVPLLTDDRMVSWAVNGA